MKKKLLVSFIASFFLSTSPVSPVFANITAGGNAGVSSQGEQGTNYTKNITNKQTKQKTKTHTAAKGQEKSWQKTKQKARRIVQGKHLSITVSAWDVISPVVNFLEIHSRIKLFKNCKLLTKPPTFNQLLKVEEDGMIDELALEYYQKQEMSKRGRVLTFYIRQAFSYSDRIFKNNFSISLQIALSTMSFNFFICSQYNFKGRNDVKSQMLARNIPDNCLLLPVAYFLF